MEGLVDKEQLSQSVLNPLLTFDYGTRDAAAVSEVLFSSVMASSDVIKLNSADEIVTYITSGFAVLMADGAAELYAVGVQGYSFRGVSEPESEVVQRGSREGFTEPLRVNMSMIRRRMKTPDLKFEQMTVGSDSKTQLMLCYLQSQVSPDLLGKLKNRLNACDLETVLASGYLSDYLEDNGSGSLFSGVGISERPDTVCGKLTEGRIAVIVDGTPAVMIVPHLFVEEFQSVDDYSNRTYYAAFIRLMKYLSFFVSVFLPGLYVALAQFHPEYFPTWLLINTSESLAQTPFPVTIEVLAITVVYEIMKEAGLRIPKSLGHAVSIVGALVIGDNNQRVNPDGRRNSRDMRLRDVSALSADNDAAADVYRGRRIYRPVGNNPRDRRGANRYVRENLAGSAVSFVAVAVLSAQNEGCLYPRRLETIVQAHNKGSEIPGNGGAGCKPRLSFRQSVCCFHCFCAPVL